MKNHAEYAKQNPSAYEGQVLVPGEGPVSVVEVANRHDMAPIIKRFEQWAITEDGLECLLLSYPISKKRFNESGRGWVAQIKEKTWADAADFERAFAEAKRHFKMA